MGRAVSACIARGGGSVTAGFRLASISDAKVKFVINPVLQSL